MHTRYNIITIIVIISLFLASCSLGESILPKPTPTPILAAAPPANAQPGDLWTSTVDGMTLVLIPAGEFIMGSDDGDFDEIPQRTETTEAFWIDLTEVTQGMYALCDAEGCIQPACVHGDNTHPVVCINWESARSYCEWAGRRLLTEIEWEKAARGTDGRIYPWGDEPASCDYAVMDDLVMGTGCGWESTWAVGSKPEGASPYGVLDMAGNVWEWVYDWDPYATNGAGRVLRGGGYYSVYSTVRAAKREVLHQPLDKNDALGFRCGASMVE
jgi:serine/threonine-protein kinase